MKFGANRRYFNVLLDKNAVNNNNKDNNNSEDKDTTTLAYIFDHIVYIYNRVYTNETSLVEANI